MKQLLQNLKTGVLDTPEIPCPGPRRGEVLVQTYATLISAGTERMLLDFGKANWVQKARRQPDKVRQVLDKIRTDGLLPTIESVQAKLDQPISLGYSNVGIVLESDIYKSGTRVVSNGPHAEVVRVPKNVTAAIPEGVSDDAAAFTVVGAIALEGIRLLAPSLGETIAVTGLGLIGLMAVQLLKAHGCRVLGLDLDKWKLDTAESFGGETVNLAQGADPIAAAQRMTCGRGVDGVLITAATQSDEPVHQAAQMCRKRGRIVLTGVTGLHLSRDDFYKKELSFQVSCSYGPGRYDPAYEQDGHDYPPAYVRWTAQRNFEAVLQLMSEGRLQVEPFITHRFPFASVNEAYTLLEGKEPYLGILLEYPNRNKEELLRRSVSIAPANGAQPTGIRVFARSDQIGVIGAGAYATKVLLPAMHGAKARMGAIASSGGVSAQYAARKFGIAKATTDTTSLFTDPSIGAVVVATRHDSHARYVCEALRAGKHIFVEKPLALRLEDLDEIERLHASRPWIVMVGFNRRFAPQAQKMRQLLATTHAPKCVVITVNAGIIPGDHWTQNRELGGGRLVGEGSHFLDLARFLVGRSIVDARWFKASVDTATLHAEFDDKSQASIHYFSNGYRNYPKERLQVFTDGKILELDNWRKLRGYGWKGFERLNLWRQDKGNAACVESWLAAIESDGESPVPLEEILEVSRWTLRAVQQ
jgi:predicted dehydrogenase/threonine dehydrogenase-like Zn-dependent dehydrogenase